jgi:hypothetical protein
LCSAAISGTAARLGRDLWPVMIVRMRSTADHHRNHGRPCASMGMRPADPFVCALLNA